MATKIRNTGGSRATRSLATKVRWKLKLGTEEAQQQPGVAAVVIGETHGFLYNNYTGDWTISLHPARCFDGVHIYIYIRKQFHLLIITINK